MKKPDGSFLKYALSKTEDPKILKWLKGIAGEFQGRPVCGHCFGVDVEIIIDPKVIKRCRGCGNFSSNIDIDKLCPMDYNAVTFLHEKKIKEILTSKQETT